MRTGSRRRWLLAVSGVVLASAAVWLVPRLPEWVDDLAWSALSPRASDPLRRLGDDFDHGRFKAGDPIRAVTAEYPPGYVVRGKRFTTAWYGEPPDEIVVVAHRGRLVAAMS